MKKLFVLFTALILSTSMVCAFSFKSRHASPSEDGCCEGHKGVCGCQGERAMCCDGSVATDCACLKLRENGEILPSKAKEQPLVEEQ